MIIALVPTVNTMGWTVPLVEHVLLADRVDRVWLYDAGDDQTKHWAWHRAVIEPRLEWRDAHGYGLHEVWNEAIAEAATLDADLAVLNTDMRLPPEALATMSRLMHEGGYGIATVDPRRPALFSQHLRGWHPELAALMEPAEPRAVPADGRIVGWAFMVAAGRWRDEPYAVHPSLKWWYGDDDLVRRAEARGVRACVIEGLGSDHLGSGSDASNPRKAEKIARDRVLFERLWAEG